MINKSSLSSFFKALILIDYIFILYFIMSFINDIFFNFIPIEQIHLSYFFGLFGMRLDLDGLFLIVFVLFLAIFFRVLLYVLLKRFNNEVVKYTDVAYAEVSFLNRDYSLRKSLFLFVVILVVFSSVVYLLLLL